MVSVIKDADTLMAPWLPRLTVYAKKIALVFEAATSGENIVTSGYEPACLQAGESIEG